MAISFSVSLLLVALITAAGIRLTSASETPAPPHPPSVHATRRPPPPPPSSSLTPTPSPSPSTSQSPPPPPVTIQEKQFGNIIDALIGTGDFGGWANLLSSANPSSLPLTATLFIPSNDAISQLLSTAQFDPLLIPYHIVPQRLNFSDLQKLPPHTRLPTLLFSKFIVITNNSASNFTVDASQITQPDFFLNSAFALHGVTKVLDYSVFNSGGAPAPPPLMPQNSGLSPWKKKPLPLGAITVGENSDAPHSCTSILITLSTYFAVLFISRIFEI